MKKIQLGNIYSIETEKGMGLFQLVNLPEDKRNDVEMIKVSYTLYPDLSPLTDSIFKDGYFFVRFPVKAALRRKLIDVVGLVALPIDFEIPEQERTEHYFEEGSWIVSNKKEGTFIQVKELTEEQLKLSPSGVWTDVYLKERLEEGWRLENWK